MKNAEHFFPLPSGGEAKLYTLTNRNGASVGISDWGGTLISLKVPDRNGELVDVVLGWKSAADYFRNPGYLGALVGRVANRIAGGRFKLNGVTYQMMLNDGGDRPNMLHGGFGYSHRLWKVAEYDEKHLALKLESPNGDAGFPGRLNIEVVYSWNDANELSIKYHAESDAPTLVNLTNHAYFNLNGEASNDVSGLSLRITADEYTPIDGNFIPTGVAAVGNSIPDLRAPTAFSEIFKQIPEGLDHNYILGRDFSWKQDCIEARSERTGIRMTVSTDRTGVQVYMGSGMVDYPMGKHCEYRRFAGFCLETQEWPDFANRPEFPRVRVDADNAYSARTVYRFDTGK